MTKRRALPRALTAGAALAALALTACGDDDKEASKVPAKLTVTETQAGKDLKIDIAGDKTPGTTQVAYTNNTKRPATAQFIAVTGGQGVAEVSKAYAQVSNGKAAPNWFFAAGGAGTTAPGKTTNVGLVLLPGTYYVVDDEDEGNLKNGGIAKFTVEGDKNEAALPTGETVTAKDYSFTATGLKSGTNTLVFANRGKQIHHLQAFPMNRGATIDQVRKFVSSDGESGGPPPIDFDGGSGTAVIEGGGTLTTDFTLKKGKYALLCFVSDRQGGPPHVAKGMVSEATVE
jgi:hypothetical protein